MNTSDLMARAAVLRQLPKGSLDRRPEEALCFLPLILVVIYSTLGILFGHCPIWLNLLLSTILGNCYAGLFCFGHYLAHGNMIRTKWLKEAMLFPCFGMLGMSPHLWKSWHHFLHHGFTNVPGRDPDSFGTIEHQKKRPIPSLFIPGGGRIIPTLFFLLTFFTGHVQTVLWVYSKSAQFRKASRLNRSRAFIETAVIFTAIGLLAFASGRLAIYTVFLPWLIANIITVSYTMTQHLLCPAPPNHGTLESTLSVRVPRWIDTLHFYNSHHVEHHLFPEAPIRTLPRIRKILLAMNEDKYFPVLWTPQFKCPKMWVALLAVFYTPRFHSADGQKLVDHKTGREVTHNFIDSVLENDGPFYYIKP